MRASAHPVRPLAWIALLGLGGCDDGRSASADAFWRARQAALDPPQLWSVAVVEAPHPGRPVLLCADTRLRSGFVRGDPAIGERSCARIGEEKRTALGLGFDCQLDGTTYRVWSAAAGDLKRDFTTHVSIQPAEGGTGYVHSLRFRHLGACPPGWNVGDSTNQHGEHVRDPILAPTP
ncbi:MAG: hypothetical protein WA840_23015 [Caulobacteraceae bacterium]